MAVSVAASGTNTCALGVCTISNASPAVIGYTAHGLAAGDVVSFTTSGSLPTGLTAGTSYYVIAAGLTANAFEVSATAGGSAINTSSAGSGTFSLTAEKVLFQSSAFGTYEYEADLSALTAGDQLVLTVYKTVLAAGASVILFQQSFIGAQGAPTTTTLGTSAVPPLAAVSKQGVCSIPASTGLSATGALSFTFSQVAGTPRAIPWSVNLFA